MDVNITHSKRMDYDMLISFRIKESIHRRKGTMGNATHAVPRETLHKNLRDYKQRDSVDTIRTYCPESDSSRGINNTIL